MAYFNYHAKIKTLIKTNHCVGVSIVEKHNNIKPAMVFYFDNHSPMPVRQYRWEEYFDLIKLFNLLLTDFVNK